jgi:hypothetical protein
MGAGAPILQKNDAAFFIHIVVCFRNIFFRTEPRLGCVSGCACANRFKQLN